jgi:recombinational DNA repair protein RecR
MSEQYNKTCRCIPPCNNDVQIPIGKTVRRRVRKSKSPIQPCSVCGFTGTDKEWINHVCKDVIINELRAENERLNEALSKTWDQYQDALQAHGDERERTDQLKEALTELWESTRHITSCRNSGTHENCAMCEAIAMMQKVLYEQ